MAAGAGTRGGAPVRTALRWTTLIDAAELHRHLDDCVVVDCRHDLANPEVGPAAWAEAHIPGAFFLHQDHDLAGVKNGRNGRHPLPDRETLRARLRSLGLADGQQLVAYDDSGGMYASRLWWLARWLGHPEVAVLDGGLTAWRAAGYPLDANKPTPRIGVDAHDHTHDHTHDVAHDDAHDAHDDARGRKPGDTTSPREPLVSHVDTAVLLGQLGTGRYRIVDARTPERYRGEVEPLDPVAGRIPGAVNRPYTQNLREDGRFKSPGVLRAEFQALLEGRPPGWLVHQCGSGVTACHNLLAMEHAGLPGASLYPGSWSEWCADRSRPVATGEPALPA